MELTLVDLWRKLAKTKFKKKKNSSRKIKIIENTKQSSFAVLCFICFFVQLYLFICHFGIHVDHHVYSSVIVVFIWVMIAYILFLTISCVILVFIQGQGEGVSSLHNLFLFYLPSVCDTNF